MGTKSRKLQPHGAEQFSDPEMEQIKRFGQALGGQPTDFDEQVEEALNKRERAREANAQKMRAAQTSGSTGLGPTDAG
jgi:hypothetical protein